MNEPINAIIIVEMMGKPADFLKKAVSEVPESIGKEKGIKVLGKKISEVKEIKDSTLFSTFAEIELEAETIQNLMIIIFLYMPSHTDIVYPENLRISNHDLSVLFNELSRRLHQYDGITKRLVVEKRILEAKLAELVGMGKKPEAAEKKEDKKRNNKKPKKQTKKKK